MSAWGMPRRLLPRKDVATPRKALGTSWHRVIQGYPNGATHPRQPGIPPAYRVGGTGGTETSQYPEEKRGFPE
jgi:hypothetical protein